MNKTFNQNAYQATLCTLAGTEVPLHNTNEIGKRLNTAVKLLQINIQVINSLVPDHLIIQEDQSITWKFATLCFYLLEKIKRNCTICLSSTHALKYLLQIGIINNLKVGVGPRNELYKTDLEENEKQSVNIIYSRLLKSVDMFVSFLNLDYLKDVIINNYMEYVLAGIIQLGYSPLRLQNKSSELLELALTIKHNHCKYKQLLFEVKKSIPKVSWVYALVCCYTNSKSPQWCSNTILRKLRNFVYSEDGVRTVAEVFLEYNTCSREVHWRRYELVVQILDFTNGQTIVLEQLIRLSEETDQDGRPLEMFHILLALYIKNLFLKLDKREFKIKILKPLFTDKFTKYLEKTEKSSEENNFEEIIYKVIPLLYKCFVDKFGIESPLPVKLLTNICNILFRLYGAWENRSDTQELESILIHFVANSNIETIISLWRTLIFNLSDASMSRLKRNINLNQHTNLNLKKFTSRNPRLNFSLVNNIIKLCDEDDVARKFYTAFVRLKLENPHLHLEEIISDCLFD